MSKLSLLENRIQNCRKCPLYMGANLAVPGDGSLEAKILFIGEAPGKKEDLEGKPFVGAAGKFLNKLLESINLERSDVYITNIVKHRPPDNRDPKDDEISACLAFLEEQIKIIQPKVIVTLGRHAMKHFLPDLKISDSHGVKQVIKGLKGEDKVYFPLYHPAAALYNPRLKDTLFADFNILATLINDSQ